MAQTSRDIARLGKELTVALEWLLDSDPSIRWQAMRDLTPSSPDEVAAARAHVASDGWGAALLDRQRPDGHWGDGVAVPHWRANLYTLLALRSFGVDPQDARVRQAIARTRDSVTWGPEFNNTRFFDGEVEPCINGGVLALGGYFGVPSAALAGRLVAEQLADGGWNCDAERGATRSSFHTTICVLEGLMEYERAAGATTAVTDARTRAHEYLLERHLFRRLSSGAPIAPRKGRHALPPWTEFTFPSMWQYDILRGLDYFRSAGVEPDARMNEAVAVVAERRQPDGRWLLDHRPRDGFDAGLEEAPGQPSRWITLRALRVLDWFRA